MDTRLVNSQLLSRKIVRVWFFLGRDYAGEASAVADNGLIFLVKVELPRGEDPILFTSGLRSELKGKTVDAEVSSPRTKAQLRLRLDQVDVADKKKGTLSLTATYASPPDPRFLKLLLEPVVTRTPKKA